MQSGRDKSSLSILSPRAIFENWRDLAKAIHDLIKYQSCYRVPHRKRQKAPEKLSFVLHAETFQFLAFFFYRKTFFAAQLPPQSKTHSKAPPLAFKSTSCMKPILVLELLNQNTAIQTLIIKYSLTGPMARAFIICRGFQRHRAYATVSFVNVKYFHGLVYRALLAQTNKRWNN